MASNEALDDAVPTPTPSTSQSTLSDDNDAVNTSHARVYFGPVLSPEKRLALDSARRRHTPLRRSSRMSTVPRHLPERVVNMTLNTDTAERLSSDSDQPRDSAETETFLDEPSSALASKIMRAWDNPSPPPSPSLPPHTSEDFADMNPLPAAPAVDSPSVGTSSSENDVATLLDTLPDAADETPSHEDADLVSPQLDLITFDSPSIPSDAPLIVSATSAEPVPGPINAAMPPSDTQEHAATVDQLLTISPRRQTHSSSPPFVEAPAIVEEILTDTTPALVPVQLDETADATQQQNNLLTPSTMQDLSLPLVNLKQVADDERATPLRRSSRQRRSVSPFVVPLVDQRLISAPSVNEDTCVLPVPADEPLLFSPLSDPAQRRSWKGKEREGSLPIESTQADNNAVILGPGNRSMTPDGGPRHEDAASGVRLKSLSPSSSGVLEKLLPGKTSGLQELRHNPYIPQPVFGVSSSPGTDMSNTPEQIPSPDPPRTPARRVPISQAVKEGSLPTHSALQFLSPRKHELNLPSAEVLASPVFRRLALDDPGRTPAKRIPISDALSSAAKTKFSVNAGFFSSTPGARSQSEEPQSSVKLVKGRSSSADPTPQSAVPDKSGMTKRTPPGTLGTPAKPFTLPFPITRTPIRSTASIPEVDESEVRSAELRTSGSSSSPARPKTIRPPPARIESRIPRIGAKPYARTVVNTLSAGSNSVKAASAVVPGLKTPGEIPVPAKPRVIRRATGKQTASSVSGAVAGPGPKTLIHRSATMPASSNTLKRKRHEEPKASPPNSQTVVIRKVTFSSTKSSSTFSKLAATALDKSPEKARSPMPTDAAARGAVPSQAKIKMRKVVTAKPPNTAPFPAPAPSAIDSNDLTLSAPEREVEVPATSTFISVEAPLTQVVGEPTNPVVIPEFTTSDASLAKEPDHTLQTEQSAASSVLEPTSDSNLSPDTNFRRTRNRKSQSDVFGTVAPPKPSRRKSVAGPDFGVFAGMSALALKSLTASNTLRNQQQVVELHTEVVRVDAKRPDSPTTKVRTILERQKEEKVLDRQRRAERRAQRASGELDIGSSDVEGESAEHRAEESPGVLSRHRRGPGEVEDYETPPKPDRPPKRGRFEDGEARPVVDKRVKWNRGLSTTVYLDDSPPKPTRVRQELSKKGCLATAAKTLRLDTMGNVLNATTPLADLVHENIIVKKFVYQDDPEPDPPSDPTIRSTRSKSKKAKS